jgi:hypothetical protein
MPKRKNQKQSNLGEQNERQMMPDRTNVERDDRTMGADQSDRTTGAEGIEDPAMERTDRESIDR